mgnify:CR=1 FL=1
MSEREVLAAADAVFDAERALRLAADTVDELGEGGVGELLGGQARGELRPGPLVAGRDRGLRGDDRDRGQLPDRR